MNLTIHQECGSVIKAADTSCPTCDTRLARSHPRDWPAPRQRIGDAERDRTITALTEHFTAGRLDQTEFERRSGLALKAVFGIDLKTLLADLPSLEKPQPPAVPEEEEEGSLVGGIVVLCGVAALAVFLVWGTVFHGFSSGNPDYYGGNYSMQAMESWPQPNPVQQDAGHRTTDLNGRSLACTKTRARAQYTIPESGVSLTCQKIAPHRYHWIAFYWSGG